jgi:hypothetical protein
MLARSLIIGAALAAVPMAPLADGGPDMYAVFRSEITSPVSVASRQMRTRTADPTLVSIVDREADRFGVPRDVARFHVARESSWNPSARNPASTAKGLMQPVRGSHAAIIGRALDTRQHLRLAADASHNAAVGMAHIRACMDFMPGASAAALWRRCHVAGHGNVGGSIRRAREHYARVVENRGWLAAGSVALPADMSAWSSFRSGGGA